LHHRGHEHPARHDRRSERQQYQPSLPPQQAAVGQFRRLGAERRPARVD
jgi:hypothetical protein